MTAPRPSKGAKRAKRAAPKRTPSGANGGSRTKARRTTDAEAVPTPVEDAGTRNGELRTSRPDEMPPWVRKAIALFFTWAVGLLVAYWVLRKLTLLLLMLLVALFLSLAMEPPVKALAARGWRRGTATALVGGGFLLATIGFFAAFGSVAFTQASQLVNNAPHYVRNVVDFLNRDFGTNLNAKSLIHDLESPNGAVQKFGRNLAKDAPQVALTIGKSLFEILVTFIFAFYLTADGPRMRRTICSRLPRQRQKVVLDTWELAVEKTGSYLYSRLLQAIVCTFAVWIFLFLLGVPSSLALAIWVGVVSQFIPTVGTYLALVLPALVTLVNSPVDTIWVLLYLVGYQQFENYFLGPRIARFTLKIHPALTIGTVLAGALLLGPVGALLALPTTAVVQALISAYTEEQEVLETPLTAEPERQKKRRRRIPAVSLRRQPGPGQAPSGPGAARAKPKRRSSS